LLKNDSLNLLNRGIVPVETDKYSFRVQNEEKLTSTKKILEGKISWETLMRSVLDSDDYGEHL
jgi:hypothetical protein